MNAEERRRAIADLRHAAERVRWAGMRATPGPWELQQCDVTGTWSTSEDEGGFKTIGHFDTEQNARWCKKMGPHIATPMAELFEEAAAWVEHEEDDDMTARPIVRFALPLAWAILRTGQTWQ